MPFDTRVFSSRCVGGYLQLVKGTEMDQSRDEVSICGANERYSPPLVQFRDFLPDEKNVAMLLFKVEETTSRTQFLAHYSFTPALGPPADTAVQIRGGVRAKDDEFSDGEN